MGGGPIQWEGSWWTQRPDGVWLRWNEERSLWEEQLLGTPPPDVAARAAAASERPDAGQTSGSHQQLAGRRQHGYGYAAPAPQGALADWWQRVVALIIDSLIVLAAASVLMLPLLIPFFQSIDPATGEAPPGPTGGFFVALAVIFALAPAAYDTFFHGRERGQTPGKMALSIRVIDEAAGGSIGYGRAFVRWLLVFVFGFVPCGLLSILDGLWPLWDQKNQALHDKVINSLVIKV